MNIPPITKEFAQRIEQNDIQYSFSRLDGIRQADGNPLCIEIKKLGNATAFLIKKWPDFWYGNKVLGLEPSDGNYIKEIIDFFRQPSLDFRIEIGPNNLNSKLASHLHKLGYCQMSFNTAIYGLPLLDSRSLFSEKVNILEVRADELNLFLHLYQDGFGLPHLNGGERRAVSS